MPQTTYTNDLVPAVAGMLADGTTLTAVIDSYPAGEDIPPGRAVDIVNGKAVLPSTATLSVHGVSLFQSAKFNADPMPATYKAGEMVPVLRRGRVWVEFSGTGATDFESAKIVHHSTAPFTANGQFTDAAASAVAGSEVSEFAQGQFRGGYGSSLALLDISLP